MLGFPVETQGQKRIFVRELWVLRASAVSPWWVLGFTTTHTLATAATTIATTTLPVQVMLVRLSPFFFISSNYRVISCVVAVVAASSAIWAPFSLRCQLAGYALNACVSCEAKLPRVVTGPSTLTGDFGM